MAWNTQSKLCKMKGHQLPHSSKETLSISWCDNGVTDGKFTEGLVYTMLMAHTVGVPINNAMRVKGNQISRQRMELFNLWADHSKTDWLLWVDSDIVLTKEVLKLLWDTADKVTRPVVTGVYFVWKDSINNLPVPMPTIFKDGRHKYEIEYIHPLPENEIIEIDSAGFGCVLMHKSIIPKLREKFPDKSFFHENDLTEDKFIGEDIIFFKLLKETGVKLYAHTGALVTHMKTIPFDISYYALFWTAYNKVQDDLKKGQADE